MIDEELAEVQKGIEELRDVVRDQLAEDLGGDPEDYDATKHPVSDGSGED